MLRFSLYKCNQRWLRNINITNINVIVVVDVVTSTKEAMVSPVSVCLDCLSVCLFACQKNNTKQLINSLRNFMGMVRHHLGTNRLDSEWPSSKVKVTLGQKVKFVLRITTVKAVVESGKLKCSLLNSLNNSSYDYGGRSTKIDGGQRSFVTNFEWPSATIRRTKLASKTAFFLCGINSSAFTAWCTYYLCTGWHSKTLFIY